MNIITATMTSDQKHRCHHSSPYFTLTSDVSGNFLNEGRGHQKKFSNVLPHLPHILHTDFFIRFSFCLCNSLCSICKTIKFFFFFSLYPFFFFFATLQRRTSVTVDKCHRTLSVCLCLFSVLDPTLCRFTIFFFFAADMQKIIEMKITGK